LLGGIVVEHETENNRFADVDLHNHWSGIGSFFGTVDFGLNILNVD
jgi:hypothetical protein